MKKILYSLLITGLLYADNSINDDIQTFEEFIKDKDNNFIATELVKSLETPINVDEYTYIFKIENNNNIILFKTSIDLDYFKNNFKIDYLNLNNQEKKMK